MGWIEESDVVSQLKDKNIVIEPNLATFSILIKGLWVIKTVKDSLSISGLTASAISNILWELDEIDVKPIALIKAFASAKDKIKSTKSDEKITYQITNYGRKFLTNSISESSSNNLTFHFLTGKEAWSDTNLNLPKLIDLLDGDVLIVDRYYGYGTLDTLSKFGKHRKISFLTAELGTEELQNLQKFEISFRKFKQEFKNIEIKKYSKSYELHDRYILAKNGIIIVGHGLKDFGNKESFVIYLSNENLGIFLPSIKAIFEERWKKSNKL